MGRWRIGNQLGEPSGAAEGLGKERAEAKAMLSPAGPCPRVPGVEPDLLLPGLRAGEQDGMASQGKERSPAPCIGRARWQGGFTSPVPSAPTIAMGVGTNIPILQKRRLRGKLCKAESSSREGRGSWAVTSSGSLGAGLLQTTDLVPKQPLSKHHLPVPCALQSHGRTPTLAGHSPVVLGPRWVRSPEAQPRGRPLFLL